MIVGLVILPLILWELTNVGVLPGNAMSSAFSPRAFLPVIDNGMPQVSPTTTSTPIPGAIGGLVWHDLDQDGAHDGGEPALIGVFVSLFDSSDQFLEWQPTNGLGQYYFGPLPPGRYQVVESDPAGYISTTPNQQLVDLEPGQRLIIDFGDYLPATPTGTATPSSSPTATVTLTPTHTATATSTGTPTSTGSPTETETATSTGSPTLTQTETGTPTATGSLTSTPTHTGTTTPTATATQTSDATSTETPTPTVTATGPTPSVWVQAEPAAAYNADRDEYLIVWNDCRNDPGLPYMCVYGSKDFSDVYARRLGGNGAQIGSDIPVATGRLGQRLPSVAYNSTSAVYLVTWQQHADDFLAVNPPDGYPGFYEYGYDTYGRRISDTGTLLGQPVLLSDKFVDPEDHQWRPDVAANTADGSFIVAWHDGRTRQLFPELYAPDETDRTTFKDIYAQIVNGNGSLSGIDVPLTLDPANDDFQFVGNARRIQQYASFAYNPPSERPGNNRYFAVWEDDRAGTGNPHVYGPLYYERLDLDIYVGFFDADGGALGGPANFPVFTGEGAQRYPRVAYNSKDNEYLVVFQSHLDGDDYRKVFAQRVAHDGSAIGALLGIDGEAVNYAGYESYLPKPDVVYNSAANRYFIVWTKRSHSSTTLWGRTVTPNGAGAALGPIFQVSGRGNEPRVVYNPTRNQYLVIYYYGAPAQVEYLFIPGS